MNTIDDDPRLDSAEAYNAAGGDCSPTPCSASLANDVARCDGVGDASLAEWREGCETCLRRTAPRPENAWMMEPPPIIAFECEYIIEPNENSAVDRQARPESGDLSHERQYPAMNPAPFSLECSPTPSRESLAAMPCSSSSESP